MGCSCSQDADENNELQLGGGDHGGLAHRRHRRRSANQRNGGGQIRDDGGDTDDAERRAAQEESDHMLAQMLFHEQILFIERQQRLDRAREARPPASPNVPGLTAQEFDAVGRVMRFDFVPVMKPASGEFSATDGAADPIGDKSHDSIDDRGAADDGSVFFATESMECALCMEDLSIGCELRFLFCGHAFHKTCVDDWLQRKRVCPMCQQDVTIMAAKSPPRPPRNTTAARAPHPPSFSAHESWSHNTSAQIDEAPSNGGQHQHHQHAAVVTGALIPQRGSFESDAAGANDSDDGVVDGRVVDDVEDEVNGTEAVRADDDADLGGSGDRRHQGASAEGAAPTGYGPVPVAPQTPRSPPVAPPPLRLWLAGTASAPQSPLGPQAAGAGACGGSAVAGASSSFDAAADSPAPARSSTPTRRSVPPPNTNDTRSGADASSLRHHPRASVAVSMSDVVFARPITVTREGSVEEPEASLPGHAATSPQAPPPPRRSTSAVGVTFEAPQASADGAAATGSSLDHPDDSSSSANPFNQVPSGIDYTADDDQR